MKIIWELYENRYLMEICNNGKIYISNIELFFEMLVFVISVLCLIRWL